MIYDFVLEERFLQSQNKWDLNEDREYDRVFDYLLHAQNLDGINCFGLCGGIKQSKSCQH